MSATFLLAPRIRRYTYVGRRKERLRKGLAQQVLQSRTRIEGPLTNRLEVHRMLFLWLGKLVTPHSMAPPCLQLRLVGHKPLGPTAEAEGVAALLLG